jgi:uncharacterized protein YkwD
MGGRVFGGLVALMFWLMIVFGATPSSAATTRDAVENEFVWRINFLRSERGLPVVNVDPELTAVARQWAASMAVAAEISHRRDLAVVGTDPGWVTVGENVGVGGSVMALHDAFVASPKHLENLVDPDWQYIGIGVVFVGTTIYVAENFMEIA